MLAIEILLEEHQIILKVLDCLEKIAEEAEKNKKLNATNGRKILDFIINFSDVCHHGKEEAQFFAALEENGILRKEGPIGCMLEEHNTGRELVQKMSNSLEKAIQGEEINIFVEAADNFIALLRGHIQKENQVLFPMASQVLGENQLASLLEHFRKFDKELGDYHHKYFEIARELCEHYQIPFFSTSQFKTLRLATSS